MTTAWIPGDEEPFNWDRWALSRYCFDREGVVVPALVDAMDRWPLERFEQIAGIAVERGDMSAAWQDFRHKRATAQAAAESGPITLTPRPTR